MKATEIKDILFNKFQDENCGFQKSDIKVNKTKNGFDVTIKDYEHITFNVELEKDDYFGYVVYVYENWDGEKVNIIFEESKHDYRIETALVRLGYRIANTF